MDMPFGLSGYAIEDGIHPISPPQQFEGGEEAYDEHIGGARRADLLRCGEGAWQLASRYASRPIESILEIGAGGGTCSIGLAAAAENAAVLVTDTSPRFLQMIGAKLRAATTRSAMRHWRARSSPACRRGAATPS
jgi:hypothetical protein